MNQKQPNRYPGVRPFQKDQAHLFFGRESDIEHLYDLILLEKLVVLFGKSGYGKSSLLNAGILPRLDADSARGPRRYLPVPVRFNTWAAQGAGLFDKFLFHLLQSAETALGQQDALLIGNATVPGSLWSWLKFARFGADTTVVLLFDQFEEFFTYPDDQQQEFKRQLAELLYADVPTYLKQHEDRHTPEEVAFLREHLDVKVVFAIRSDRLSALDRLKDKLPAILHKRCELRALTREQAREALVEPARQSGAFASPRFIWTAPALTRILDEFAHDQQGREVGVEAFLLQVLAQTVETSVSRGAIADRDGDGMPDVCPEDLPEDLGNVFSDYYRNKIGDLPQVWRLPARRLIEDGLILASAKGDARRLSMDGDVLLHQSGADRDLLKALEDTFLLRRELNSLGGWNYELSHDTLLKPVLDWREERRAEEQREADRLAAEAARQRTLELEARAAEERRRAEEAERLKNEAVSARQIAETEKKKAQKMTFFAIGLAALASLATLGAGYLYDQSKKALLELAKARTQDVRNILRDAANQIKKLDYAAAAERTYSAAILVENKAGNSPLALMRPEVADILLEIAFFYTETGRYARAKTETETAARLLGAPTPLLAQVTADTGRTLLLETLRTLRPDRWDSLLARYYPVLLPVPGGTFFMGNNYAVSLSPYQLARTETTVWQYNLYLAAEGKDIFDRKTILRPGWGFEGDDPIVIVNWFDACRYANWLSRQFGLQEVHNNFKMDTTANGFCLPTEAEWVFAARGGPTGIRDSFTFAGSNNLYEVGWFDQNSGAHSNAVAQLKPNQLGFYDLSGNVWEWCADDEPADYPSKNLTGASLHDFRVLRGGSWHGDINDCRLVGDRGRIRLNPGDTYADFGFRLARHLSSTRK